MGSNYPISILSVGAGNRLTCPPSLFSDSPLTAGKGDRIADWFPYHWVRDLDLPQGELLQAWVLTDLSSEPVAEGSHGIDQWKHSPVDILNDDEWEDQQLRQLLFKSQIYPKGKHWRFTIPLQLRLMRCLPERGGSVLCHRDGQLIVVWDIVAWKLHKARLGGD